MDLPLAHQNIMRSLAFHHLLTEKQLRRLLGYAKSLSQGSVTRLKQAGLIEEGGFIPIRRTNNPPYYRLTQRGLKELGLDWKKRKTPRHSQLNHTMAINDVLIGARRLERFHGVELTICRHDLEIKRHPLLIGKRQVIPDALLVFEWARHRRGVLIEVDLGSEQSPSEWARKIEGLVLAARGPFREEYLAGYPVIAVTTPNTSRRETVTNWTRLALARMREERYLPLFLFSECAVDADELFTHPVWYPADSETPAMLLEVGAA